MAAPDPKSRLDLPFRPRKTDAGEWAYDHRVGLCVVVIFFLVLGIAMVSARIALGDRQGLGAIYVELEEMPPPPPEEQPREQLRELSEDDFRDAQNQISNANAAENQARTSAASRELARQLDAQSRQLSEQMSGNRRALEAGRAREAAIDAQRNAPSGDDAAQNQDTKVAGRVLVEFSLANPLRTSVDLVVPGYRCRGGGEVIIEIVVDRSGRVTSASVARSSRSVDQCMVDAALAAARASQFNLDGSAPERHRGTITYLFVPQ